MTSATQPATLKLDYTLTGVNSALAIEKGLAEADWYQCPVPRETMRALLQRRDGPALFNTALWFGLIFTSAYATWKLWGTWWAVIPYLIYAALYGSTSDARWHESGHGTAFKTDWLNSALYEIASFMVLRESTVWRWSHTRHHSDTIIVGRDPEISVPRPADPLAIAMKFFSLTAYPKYFSRLLQHSFGRMTADEKTYIPGTEFRKIFRKARVHLAIYALVAALAIGTRSWFPLFLIGFANLFGAWLMVMYSMTQHAGLAENVLDHRLNCRTVYMNPINRFLYWNMNYHIEHHMYPLVPFHALPRLHELIKDDCPPPYPSLFAAWREILSAVRRQIQDPAYHVKRRLPERHGAVSPASSAVLAADAEADNGWIPACPSATLGRSDVARLDHGRKTYVVCRSERGDLFALDGVCTHGNVHLSEGLVKGDIIECPKHNGRYHLNDGSPARVPVCRGLTTYPVEDRDGLIHINVDRPNNASVRPEAVYELRVVSNLNVATFIKELVLEPIAPSEIAFTPGDYLQLEIPAYESISFRDFDIQDPFRPVWNAQHLFDLVVSNPAPRRNNYSLASNGHNESTLRFNVRIAAPPPGQDCPPGVGSSYVFHLRMGDVVRAFGPFGDFHIRPTQREMIYIGGGAGMAPLRAHLSHLLETDRSARKISFWYGARSRQELFYDDYFDQLAELHRNFTFVPALSSPLPEDAWEGYSGFIHEVLFQRYLATHPNPRTAEYYLCGPPLMIKACNRMLAELGVPATSMISDEF